MLTPIKKATLEETIIDVDSVAKKSLQHKRYPWVIYVLKELVGATTIIKHIVDLGVRLTVGELLASTPTIKKQLIKAISEDDVV